MQLLETSVAILYLTDISFVTARSELSSIAPMEQWNEEIAVGVNECTRRMERGELELCVVFPHLNNQQSAASNLLLSHFLTMSPIKQCPLVCLSCKDTDPVLPSAVPATTMSVSEKKRRKAKASIESAIAATDLSARIARALGLKSALAVGFCKGSQAPQSTRRAITALISKLKPYSKVTTSPIIPPSVDLRPVQVIDYESTVKRRKVEGGAAVAGG